MRFLEYSIKSFVFMSTKQALYGLYFSNLASDSLSFSLFTIHQGRENNLFTSDSILIETSDIKSTANTLKLYYEIVTKHEDF